MSGLRVGWVSLQLETACCAWTKTWGEQRRQSTFKDEPWTVMGKVSSVSCGFFIEISLIWSGLDTIGTNYLSTQPSVLPPRTPSFRLCRFLKGSRAASHHMSSEGSPSEPALLKWKLSVNLGEKQGCCRKKKQKKKQQSNHECLKQRCI